MSSMVRHLGLLNNNGSFATHLDVDVASLASQSEAATVDFETNENHRLLSFKSLTLKELCMELDKCTEDTQKLQEELENATKVTLGRFGNAHTAGLSSVCGALGELLQNQMIQHISPSLESSDQQMISPRAYGSSGKFEFENAMDDCIQQFSIIEIKTSEQQELCNPAMNLQTGLHKVQMDKDVVSDLRLKDSKRHAEDMEKMLHILEEVQVTKRCGDQRLEKTQEEALALNRKIETLEQILKKHHTHCPEVQCWPNTNANANVESASVDFNKGAERQHNENAVSRPCLLNQEHNGVNKEAGRIEKLIDCISQEMALLSDKLNSSKSCSVSLTEKLELLKKLAEKQLLHDAQVFELKKIHFSHEKQHTVSLDDARNQCQKLQIETEDLRMKLEDKDTCIEILRLQLESSIQQSEQQSSTIDNLHQEKIHLNNQIKQHKLDIMHLEAELDHCRSSLAALEHKKCQLQHSVAKQSRRVQEDSLAKRQLTIEIDKQHLQLVTLTEEHKELQQLYSCKNKENEGVVLKLQSHMKNVQAELDQVRSTLWTLQGTDGYGFKEALTLQKEITNRRKQVDSLQSKIQHLEESKEKLCQEKLYQNLENKHQFQELASIRTEKKQLSKELEAVQLKDKYLRERISELEAVLHKMSESFADCQAFVHLREQEFYCLKLKHALDLKEHHSKNTCSAPKQDGPTSDHLFRDVQGVISKKHRPHTASKTPASSGYRRRSAPESVQRTAFSTDKTKGMDDIRLRRKHSGSELHNVKIAELNGKIQHNSFSQEPLTSTPTATTCRQLLGHRSPVHTLLTSDPYK